MRLQVALLFNRSSHTPEDRRIAVPKSNLQQLQLLCLSLCLSRVVSMSRRPSLCRNDARVLLNREVRMRTCRRVRKRTSSAHAFKRPRNQGDQACGAAVITDTSTASRPTQYRPRVVFAEERGDKAQAAAACASWLTTASASSVRASSVASSSSNVFCRSFTASWKPSSSAHVLSVP